MGHDHRSGSGVFLLIVLGLTTIAGFFLLVEHRAHLFAGNWGTGILLLAFFGLHLLMHRGHGGHGGHGGRGGGGGCGGRRNDPARDRARDDVKEIDR